MNPETIRKDFKIFENRDIAYLDSGATSQRPYQVLKAVEEYYNKNNANPHRGTYDLSIDSTAEYDKARAKVAKFINAKRPEEIVFTKNATEALNLVANSYGLENLQEGDTVVISIMEHHSNLVPWQKVTKIKNAKLEYMYINRDFEITDEEINKKITDKTKIVSITEISNVLGVKTPLEKIIKRAHEVGAIVIVDGSQSVPHIKVDVQKMDADFFVFSGHKLMAPMGIGVLYGKYELLQKMDPLMSGGGMNARFDMCGEVSYLLPPQKFEAGTQNIAGALGLAKAAEYLTAIGMENIEAYEKELRAYAIQRLEEVEGITIYNRNAESGIITFNLKDVFAQDAATYFNSKGVCVRSGQHCAKILMDFLKCHATVRASIYFYNTKEEIDALVEACKTGGDFLDAYFN